MTKPKATYIGMQERVGKPPIPLYNVTGGRLDKSTVSAETCRREGIVILDSATETQGIPRWRPSQVR